MPRKKKKLPRGFRSTRPLGSVKRPTGVESDSGVEVADFEILPNTNWIEVEDGDLILTTEICHARVDREAFNGDPVKLYVSLKSGKEFVLDCPSFDDAIRWLETTNVVRTERGAS